MKSLKKYMALLLALLMCLSMAACGELKVDTYKYFKEIYKDEK